jgi:hypothetical protein
MSSGYGDSSAGGSYGTAGVAPVIRQRKRFTFLASGSADSGGYCNSKLLGRRREVEALAWALVELVGDGVEFELGDLAEVGALGEVLAQQPVGVLIGAALPGGVRIAEVDLDVGADVDWLLVAQLGSLVPGQRTAQ